MLIVSKLGKTKEATFPRWCNRNKIIFQPNILTNPLIMVRTKQTITRQLGITSASGSKSTKKKAVTKPLKKTTNDAATQKTGKAKEKLTDKGKEGKKKVDPKLAIEDRPVKRAPANWGNFDFNNPTVHHVRPSDAKNCFTEICLIHKPPKPVSEGQKYIKTLHVPLFMCGYDPAEYFNAWALVYTKEELADYNRQWRETWAYDFPPLIFTSIKERHYRFQNFVYRDMREKYIKYYRDYQKSKTSNSFTGNEQTEPPLFEEWSAYYRDGIKFVRDFYLLHPHLKFFL